MSEEDLPFQDESFPPIDEGMSFNEETLEEYITECTEENAQLKEQNQALRRQVAVLLQVKSISDRLTQYLDATKGEEDGARMQELFASIEEGIDELNKQEEALAKDTQERRERLEEVKRESDEAASSFSSFRSDVIRLVISLDLKGSNVTPEKLNEAIANIERNEAALRQARQRYIDVNEKLRLKRERFDAPPDGARDAADPAQLIDFEQRRMENQTLAEKIESRSEELLRLRRKVVDTIQVTAHMREKLEFMRAALEKEEKLQASVTVTLAQLRDSLSVIKRDRMSVRKQIEDHHRRMGLVGNPALMRDYEAKLVALEQHTKRLAELKEFCDVARRRV